MAKKADGTDGLNAGAVAPDVRGWPPICTLAELARILTMVHGVRAPAESSLKKWSAAGAFRSCVISKDAQAAEAPSSFVQDVLERPRRAGRPGLKLRTALALARVYELWPHLSESDPSSVIELVVARAADHLRSAIPQSTSSGEHGTGLVADANTWSTMAQPAFQEMERQLALLTQEMMGLKREVAQFSALRNNLITRLDDAVARVKAALDGGQTAVAGFDPLVEARRDRDMGVMKSSLAEILSALERIESQNVARAGPTSLKEVVPVSRLLASGG